MLITSLKPTLQGILRFWRSKHGSISLFFCYPSLFIYIFFHCRNEVANKPVVHSVITNALGILFFCFFCLNFLFFLSFYMFCIASFSESSKSELITEPVAKASFEIFSKAIIFEFVQKIDFTLLFCSCHLHSFKFRAFGIIHFLFLKKKVFR